MSLNNFVKISEENEKYPEHSDDFAKLRKHWNITPEFYKEELSKMAEDRKMEEEIFKANPEEEKLAQIDAGK